MINIVNILGDQTLVIVAQLLVGKYLKGLPWFENKLIPIVTLLVSYLGFTLAPASAAAASSLGGVTPALGVGAMAILQTILVTGIHGVSKNTVFPLLKLGLKAAALTILKEKN